MLHGLYWLAASVAFQRPTLLVIVPLEHTFELYRALPHGRLVVVPGTSHPLLHEKPDLCVGWSATSSPPHRLRPGCLAADAGRLSFYER